MSEQERDFLDEDVPDEAAPDEVTPDTEAGTEKGEAPPPETPEPKAPPAEEPKQETVPLASLMAERDKRQEEARQRQQLERELAQYRQQTQQEQQPGFYEAPEQYVRQIEHQATQRLHAALEASARESYADYDEVLDDVKQYTDANPAYVDQIMAAPNPVLAAYKFGKHIREMQKMQDPEAYRQSIEAEVRAKVEAEFTAKAAERAKTAEALPPDLAANRSAKGTFLPAANSVFDEIFP